MIGGKKKKKKNRVIKKKWNNVQHLRLHAHAGTFPIPAWQVLLFMGIPWNSLSARVSDEGDSDKEDSG